MPPQGVAQLGSFCEMALKITPPPTQRTDLENQGLRALLNARLLSFRNQLASFDAIPQLALLGLASGLTTGVVILLFRAATEIPLRLALPNGNAEGFESLPFNARFMLPVIGGIVLGLILYLFRVENRKVGVAHVMERLSYHQGYISFKSGLLQFLCGVLTISSGQSCGREGPAVHLGATSSSLLGQWLQLPNNSIRTLVGCGTAAAISASFNTPIAGVIFAMEVVMLEYSLNGFTPVIIAAVTAALVTQTVYGNEPAFQVPSYDMQSFWELPFILLVADFRLQDVNTWKQWYGEDHVCPEILAEAVYGLPELNRESIRSARLVANPGCYPTAVQLGFLPLLAKGLVDTQRLVADAKSGVSGAGRGAKVANLLCEVSESFKAYGASGHRHLPEIKQGLSRVAGQSVGLTFVPHLVPMVRGIEATLYAEINEEADFQALYETYYCDEPFVDVMPFGSLPETRTVRGTNVCRIALHRQPESRHLVIVSVIDNLVKGAAGQAVHNMNLMAGLPETAGLDSIAILP